MAEREDISKELGNLKSDISELKEHMGALARVVKDVAKTEGAETKARFEAQAQDMLDRMARMLDDAKTKGQAAYHTVEHQVQERPMTSVAASMGIGVLLGMLVGKLFFNRRD